MASAETLEHLNLLRQQKLSVEQERKELQQLLEKLDQTLALTLKRAPRKPRQSLEQLQQEIDKLEFDRSTTSMSLQEEKKLLKKIDKLKADMKIFDTFDDFEDKLEALRKQQRAIRDRLNANRTVLHEARSSTHKLEIAKRISAMKGGVPISPSIIVEVRQPLKKDKIGIIVGKQGSSLKKLEEKYAVVVDILKQSDDAIIHGIADDAEAARAAIDAINNEISVEINLSNEQVVMLKRNKGKYLRFMEEILAVSLRITEVASKPVLVLRGSEEKAKAASQMVQDLASFQVTLALPTEVIPVLIGSGGETINKLQDDHFVGIDLLRESNQVKIFGSELQVLEAKHRVQEIIEENVNVVVEIPVAGSAVAASIIGKGGETVRRIESETGSSINVSSGNAAAAKIVITANKAKIGMAEEAVREALATYSKQNAVLTYPDELSGFLFDKKGGFQQLKESLAASEDAVTLVAYRDSKSGELKVTVRSEREDLVLSTVAQIEEMVGKQTTRSVAIEKSAIPSLIGRNGANISKLQSETGTFINVKGSTVVVRGDRSNVDVAVERVEQLLDHFKNTNMDLYVVADSVGVLIGKGGSKLKAIREETGATVDIQKPKAKGAAGNDDDARNSKSPQGYVIQKANVANIHISADTREEMLKAAELITQQAGGSIVDAAKKDMMTCAVVEIPCADSCGVLVGNRGQTIKGLESAFNVVIEVFQRESRVSIHGRDAESGSMFNLETVAKKVRDLLMAGIPKEDVVTIRGKAVEGLNDREIRNIQLETNVKIQVNKTADNTAEVSLSGSTLGVDIARTILVDMVKGVLRDRIRVSPEHLQALVAKGSRNIKRLENQIGVGITLDEPHSCIRLRGGSRQIEQGKGGVRQLLRFLFPDNYTVVSLPSDAIPAIIGKKGSNVRRIQEEHGVSIDAVKSSNEIVVSGAEATKVLAAKADVEACLQAWQAENKEIPIQVDLIPGFIGKKGAGIKAIEQECPKVNVNVDREASMVRVRGSDVETVDKAVTMINEQLEKLKAEAARRVEEFARIEEERQAAYEQDQENRKRSEQPVFKFVQDDAPEDEMDRAPTPKPQDAAVAEDAKKVTASQKVSLFGNRMSKAALKNKRRKEKKLAEKAAAAAAAAGTDINKSAPIDAAAPGVEAPNMVATEVLGQVASRAPQVTANMPQPVPVMANNAPQPAQVTATSAQTATPSKMGGGAHVAPSSNNTMVPGFPPQMVQVEAPTQQTSPPRSLFQGDHGQQHAYSHAPALQPPLAQSRLPTAPHLGQPQTDVSTNDVMALLFNGLPSTTGQTSQQGSRIASHFASSTPPMPPGFDVIPPNPAATQQAPAASIWEGLLPTPPPGFGGPQPSGGLGQPDEQQKQEGTPYYQGSGGYTVRLS